MIEFTDMYGNQIKQGDEVVYCLKTSKYTSQLAKAVVVKFTNQKVRIALLNDKDVAYKFILVTPSKLVKAPTYKTNKINYIKAKFKQYMNKIKKS